MNSSSLTMRLKKNVKFVFKLGFILSYFLLFNQSVLVNPEICLFTINDNSNKEISSSSYHFAGDHSHNSKPLNYVQNKKQWHPKVKYAAHLGNMDQVYLENDGFVFSLLEEAKIKELHDVIKKSEHIRKEHIINGHAYKVEFLNALQPEISGNIQRKAFNNYFLGNDPNKWSTEVPVFEKVMYKKIYNNIDIDVYSNHGNFKYDFIISKNGDPKDIKLKYNGLEKVELIKGNLVLTSSIKTLTELAPYAYQKINGEVKKVICNYILKDNVVTFDFPNGYNKDELLVIDPTLIVSTLSGTRGSENYGHSATYDNAGNIYTGGISFGRGYPTTTGAFQINYAGGGTDICISKYDEDGSNLVYATYIGGSEADYPHSLICDNNGQLCILGTSGSSNYPTTSNAIQNTYGGETDIVVTKLNATGSGLIGSTYKGGSASDGINLSFVNAASGDQFRGEIILDAQGNIYIASCSSSEDFGVSANAIQTTLNTTGGYYSGGQDGVVMKFNNDLSRQFWATYLGGDNEDICSSLRVDDFGDVYTTGVAAASNFPMASNGLQPTWPGGQQSSFVLKLSSDGSSILNGTFWGTDMDDKGYFIDLDEDGQAHIFGTTTGTMPITPDTYFFNPGSPQFFAAFNSDLDSLIYSTVIGSGSGGYYYGFADLVPVAFMVDKCNGIYFSGYNAFDGFPTTTDAFAANTFTFFLGVLEPNAASLIFGTYYGEADHVDGGTSRFDKGGIVYQAVCSCEGTILNTTANAWEQNQFTPCDVGVFKIDFDISTVTASAMISPDQNGCAPYTVDFMYTGQDATSIFWDFGNGDTSTDFNPIYTFTEPGTFTITQIVDGENTCNIADTFYLEIDVFGGTSTSQNISFCPGQDDQIIDAFTNNASYIWSDASTSSSIVVNSPGIYWVDISIDGCMRRDTFLVGVNSLIDLGDDLFLCENTPVLLTPNFAGAVSYLWQDGSTDPTYNVTSSGQYWVNVIDDGGCEYRDTINVDFQSSPIIDIGPDTSLCQIQSYTLDATSDFGNTYLWEDGSDSPTLSVMESGEYFVTVSNGNCETIDSVQIEFIDLGNISFLATDVSCGGENTGSINTSIDGGANLDFIWSNNAVTPFIENLSAGDYAVTISQGSNCSFDTLIRITEPAVLDFNIVSQPEDCPGFSNGSISLEIISGGNPPFLFGITNEVLSDNLNIDNLNPGQYSVTVQDSNNCTYTELIEVSASSITTVDAGPDRNLIFGESVQIEALLSSFENQVISWSPSDSLSCFDCINPTANPIENTEYTITVTDTVLGCIISDAMLIFVERPINVFIPNVFSPNKDGINDSFFIQGDETVSNVVFLSIYNRWGDQVFAADNFLPNDPSLGWDGRFLDKEMNSQVFVYAAEVEFIDGTRRLFKGDLTLIR